jgi:hypothetical protein
VISGVAKAANKTINNENFSIFIPSFINVRKNNITNGIIYKIKRFLEVVCSMPSSIAKPILAGTWWARLETTAKCAAFPSSAFYVSAKALSKISPLSQIGFAIPD